MRPLPGAIFGDIVRGATWVGDIPVVVAEPAPTNFGPGALVWLAASSSGPDWTRRARATPPDPPHRPPPAQPPPRPPRREWSHRRGLRRGRARGDRRNADRRRRLD